ncbi:urease accessory protein UreF [Bifidobacterium vespertilionis]|uniref:urease accessory protein UreF n=1 Tax=Bifidobacterium vespertilionis TaxID=2562524 RepID=UPI001BDCE192|nr:urease accessory UreF family protein [Bifidobacterium vespertilionis]MBT1180243.1 urease accessory protein UreF [Bifidobacterium vespertilionis]
MVRNSDADALNMAESRRLAMLQVCDSVFPVGAFALSNGMETFVQRDFLRRGADFEQYMKNYLDVAPYKEIGQMVLAGKYGTDARLSQRGLATKLTELDELASALQSAREIREGSERMCVRLVKLVRQMDAGQVEADRHRGAYAPGRAGVSAGSDGPEAAGDSNTASDRAADNRVAREDEVIAVHKTGTERHRLHGSADNVQGSPALDLYASLMESGRCRGLHSIAMGLYAADHATSIRDAAVMYGYSLLSALTMCAAKAIPLSQNAGQIALHDSFPRLVRAVDVAMTLKPEDLGISGAYLDIAAMQHETLYSRLYMS